MRPPFSSHPTSDPLRALAASAARAALRETCPCLLDAALALEPAALARWLARARGEGRISAPLAATLACAVLPWDHAELEGG